MLVNKNLLKMQKEQKEKQIEIEKKKAKHRMHCRLNQRRYRQKQLEVVTKLSQECKELKATQVQLWKRYSEVKSKYLEYKSIKEVFLSGQALHDNGISIAKGYFQQFRKGFQFGEKKRSQLNFLNRNFNESLELECGNGLNQLVNQLSLYSSLHSSIQAHYSHVQCIGESDAVVVRVEGCVHLTISRKTIESIYPRLLQYEWLIQKLIGKELKLHTITSFYFSKEAGPKCKKLDVELDYTAAWTRLIEDMDILADVLNHAKINGSYTLTPEIPNEQLYVI